MSDYERIRSYFDAILGLSGEARSVALADLAEVDPSLHEAVTTLLADHQAAETNAFLDSPLIDRRAVFGDGTVLVGREADSLLPLYDEHPAISGYEMLGELGRGSNGIVYRARSLDPLEREIAVKVLRSDLPAGVRARFEREQRALASLNHPGIAQVYDAGFTADGRPFVGVELVEGGWITRAADRHGVPWRRRIEAMISVCEAVHYMHGQGVLHRDLKPANILATFESGSLHAKVIDFGSAILADHAVPSATVGQCFVGTIAYMSPEQLAGRGRLDIRIDVYALGIIIHELLTGVHPYGGDAAGLASLVARVERSELPGLPSSLGSDRRPLDAVLAKACAADRDGRYPSVQHLADDLRRVLEARPVEASARSPIASTRAAMRRHPWACVAALCSILMLSAGSIAILLSARESARSAERLRNTVSVLVDGVLEELRELSGVSVARRELGMLVLDQIDSVPRAMVTQRMRHQRALALEHVGDASQRMGDFTDAHTRFTEANRLYTELGTSSPDDRSLREARIRTLIKRGDALRGLGDDEGAATVYAHVHDSLLRQLEADPDDLDVLEELTWSYERIAAGWNRPGQDAPAQDVDERIRIAEIALAGAPDDPRMRFAAACAWQHAAQRAWSSRDAEATRSYALLARDQLRVLLGNDPDRFAYRTRELSVLSQLVLAGLAVDADDTMIHALEYHEACRRFVSANADFVDSDRYVSRAKMVLAEVADRFPDHPSSPDMRTLFCDH
ncbi:MAG: serine/threonine protein kinase [Phycisphaerales bacterium]